MREEDIREEAAPAPRRSFVPRGRHLFVYDLVAVLAAIAGAFALRFDAGDVVSSLRPYLPVVLLPLLVQPVVNVVFGLYRREWRYASMREMVGVLAAVGTGTAIVAALLLLLSEVDAPGTAGLPRSFVLLEGLLSLVLIGGGRFAIRWALDNAGRSGETDDELGLRTLVYGAGEAGAAIARISRADRGMQMQIVGFLDDDAAKHGSRLFGARIYGDLDRLDEAARRTYATQLVVAMPSAPGAVVRRAVDAGRTLGLIVKIVPPLHEILGGHDKIVRLRSVSLDDLLRREPVRVDLDELAGYLNGANVLVTGAGGSIGSELVRQIVTLGPRSLTILDNNEAGLWAIERELGERHPMDGPLINPVLGDVRSSASLDRVIEATAPDVVFHAAALKHVPICEAHPSEAVLTNVIGTRNILAACGRAEVSRFVLISTDKAVQPVSVMGATKRLAEVLTLTAGRRARRSYLAVRFGNVLGSSGSVVPVFRRQLEQGLPITITHPDATRYFMTIPEAVSLILQAGASETSGDVFILDMGEPVRIVDLAADMIRLSGLDPSSVDIVYTGLRPGERLTEQLVHHHEALEPTEHDRVSRTSASIEFGLGERIDRVVADLEASALASDDRAVRTRLRAAGFGIAGSERKVQEVPA